MKFRDSTAPLEDRIEDFLERLNIEESTGLMKHEADGVPSIGIPETNRRNEALPGVARKLSCAPSLERVCCDGSVV